jgi:HSP20 family molecular chaperone IbpA
MRWHGAQGEAVLGGYKGLASVDKHAGDEWGEDAHGPKPAIDLEDHGPHYRLVVEVPGMDVSELRIAIEPDYLVLEGRWGATKASQEGGKPLLAETKRGRFLRVVNLPEAAAGEEAQAVLENGILVITLPKRDAF